MDITPTLAIKFSVVQIDASLLSTTLSKSLKMEVLRQYPEEYQICFRYSFKFLAKFNIRYLKEDEPAIKRFWRFIYIVPAMVIHFAATTYHIIKLLSNGQMTDVAYVMPPYLVTLHSILKAIVIVPKTAEISSIIRELGGLWRTELTTTQNKEKNGLLKILRMCTGGIYWVTILGTSQYLLSPILETVVRRFILQQDCELLLPIAATYPLDATNCWLIYIGVYMLQLYTMCSLVLVYSGAELIMITLCALVATDFMILKEDMSKVKPVLNTESVGNTDNHYCIEDFIRRHQGLIRLSRQLDNVFNRLIFIDLLFVGITTCAFSFAGDFARSRGLTYMMNNYVAVLSSMSTVLYLCYYGELLINASSQIGDAAYTSTWYKGSREYRKAIWLIIKISNNPCCLTSLKYAVVSLNMFTKVVSTTWSYFSLLNSVYSEVEQE